MARINIEDQFWIDILNIVEGVGSMDLALGQALRFLKFAQEKHKQGEFISDEEFESRGFHKSLIGIFAKRTPNGIQAKGSEKHFDWIDQKREAGKKGGQASAKRPRDEKGRLLKKDQANPSEVQAPDSKQTQAKPNGHQPSISISTSISSSNSISSNTTSTEVKESPQAPVVQKMPSKFDAENIQEITEALPKETLERWVHLYQDKDFLQRELVKAFGYYAQDNPKKKPKSVRGWSMALSSWFERAWSYQAKHTKGRVGKENLSTDEILKHLGGVS